MLISKLQSLISNHLLRHGVWDHPLCILWNINRSLKRNTICMHGYGKLGCIQDFRKGDEYGKPLSTKTGHIHANMHDVFYLCIQFGTACSAPGQANI